MVGVLMSSWRYSPELCRSEAELAELREWHAGVADSPFDFKQQAVDYCLNDCLVMALCAEKLEQVILEQTDNEISFLNSTTFTLASTPGFVLIMQALTDALNFQA